MSSTFTVSATGGFIDPAGNAWSMRGLNATPQDCVIWSNPDTVLAQYPGLTCIRLNCNTGSDTDADIDAAVKAYTARGVVVMIEDHGGNQANLAWYTKMATLYKSNPYVFLETPNEPSAAAAQTAQNQIAVINAIKATGFANPIGLQPVGGYDGSNFPAVIQAIGTNQIFATPHIYYYQNDPNYAAAKVADWIANDKALGLFTSVDEFGNDAGDGYSLAPQGNTVVTAVIAANEAGKAGAVFWAMGNGHHPNGVDSAFLTADGTQLTPEGVLLQPWLSQATGGLPPPPPLTSSDYLTPGVGSFTDAAGNVYTLDASGNVNENGQPVAYGSGTSAMEYYDGLVCAQDAVSKQWYTWDQSTWTAAAAPPPPTTQPTLTLTVPTITGTAQEGQTLTAAATAGQGANPVTYRWLDNGTAIAGATGATYVVKESDEGHTITVVATATNAAGATVTQTSKPTATVIDAAPTVTKPTITGTAQQGQTLTAAATAGEPDNLVTYQWLDNGTAISGATGATYVIQKADVGKTITVAATATNDNGVKVSQTSAATAAVTALPATTLIPYLTPGVGSFADAAGNVYALDASGNVNENGQPVAYGSGTSAMEYYNNTVYAQDAASKQWYTWDQSTWTAAAAPPPPTTQPTLTLTVPTITGTAQEGQTLTAAATAGQGANPVTYRWLDNGTAIAGATGATYVVKESDEGHTITVVATATNAAGATVTQTSKPTATVIDAAPTVTKPTITGTAQQGQTLTAAATAGEPDNLVTYQWLDNGTAISGATGATYVIQKADVGKTITVAATATNDNGVKVSQTSAATAAVTALPATTLIPYLTPGVGSFADAAGNVYALDASGNVNENGQPVAYGSGTSAMEYYNNTVYAQDAASKQWYTWDQSTWTAAAAPPPPTTQPAAVVTGAGSDTLVLAVSEDAYQGNAQFTVSVDGKQLGGTFTATASHAAGASQNFTFKGDFGTGAHAVAVTFTNDLYAGTAATDRNLYVNDIVYNGADTKQSAALVGNVAKAFTVTGGTTPAVSETGDHGSLAKTFAQTGTYKVGGDTFVLTAGNAATVTLGTGTSQIKFLGASAVTLTGGSGSATVVADAGTNKFTAGAGTLDVTGGGGKDSYVFHAGNGLLKLEDFSAAKGDTLSVDKALQGAMTQTADGQGGVMLSFGAGATHGVDIHGLAALPAANILWA